MSPHEIAVICRFSRSGRIPWQQVADMLGRHRDSLKTEWEALPSAPITLDPPGIGPVDGLPEPESYRSTRARSNLRFDLIAMLARRSSTVLVMAAATGRTEATVRDALAQMRRDGIAVNDGQGRFCQPATWFLTDFGREVYNREKQQGQAA